MDTEETKPSRIKKFLKITLGVLGTLAVLLSTAFVLTAMKNAKQFKDVHSITRELTEAEKLLQAQIAELDRMRTERQGTTTSMTIENQVRTLDALRSQTLKQKTTASIAPKTLEQQAQGLDVLRAALNK